MNLGTFVNPMPLDINIKTYSRTEEQVVGKWVDGQEIYQMTFAWTTDEIGKLDENDDPNYWSYFVFADHEKTKDIEIGQIINISGIAYCYDGIYNKYYWQPVPRVVPNALNELSIGFGNIDPDKVGILFGTSYSNIAAVYVTIEYTKSEIIYLGTDEGDVFNTSDLQEVLLQPEVQFPTE